MTISVLNLLPAGKKTGLMALADVEIIIDGISMQIHGVQVVADDQKTAVRLPRHRTLDGSLQASVSVPEEIKAPLAEAVMAAGIEAKLLIQRTIFEKW